MPRFTLNQVADILHEQDGAISRQQLFGRGARQHDIDRLLRRRDLSRRFTGVFVCHTGPLTPRQREWIAVLAAWPAALTGMSVLGGRSNGIIELLVGPGRKVRVPRGVRVRRAEDFEARVEQHRSPPRVRLEHALIDEMSTRVGRSDIAGAFAVLADTAFRRVTTPDRILAALDTRTRVRGRATIRSLVQDLRDGACSVLERGYLHHVERAHGLPRPDRQHASRATGRTTSQDIRYPAYGVVFELDGRSFHASAGQADSDALRDLAELATTASVTGRITYGLVFDRACHTARLVAGVLQQRGWQGALTPCYRCPRHTRAM